MVIESKFGKFDDNLAIFIRATDLVDSDNAYVKKRANTIAKDLKTPLQAITAIYSHVAFFPESFDKNKTKASEILKREKGNFNTKTTLFTALARVLRIPTRVHAWKVEKSAFKSRVPALSYILLPHHVTFIHPEVFYNGKWQLLTEVLCKKNSPKWQECPFHDSINRKFPLKEEWIEEDLGSFWHPDKVFEKK